MPGLPTAAPETHGLRSVDLARLIDELEDAGLDPHALVVARHGTVLFRAAWAPWSASTPALVYSVSKTFTALAIGFLADEGRLDITAPVDRYLSTPNPRGLTVRHLLTMNTGHDREQTLELDFSVEELLTSPAAHAPGEYFAYNSPASFVLSAIVSAITGESITAYLRPRLFDPLGIGVRYWTPLDDLDQGFSGLHLTVDDIARVAIALADDGRFEGRQVIPAWFVDEAAQAWSDNRDPDDGDGTGDWALGYGYQVWRSRYGYRLDGAYGQFGLVVPERGIVIAYQGATTETNRTMDAFTRLIEAFGDEPGAPGGRSDASSDPSSATPGWTRDSWAARGLLRPQDPPIDVTGWALVDDGERWRLSIPDLGIVEFGPDAWSSLVVGPPDASLAIAVRGERREDGVLVHIATPTSPHRFILTRDGEGLHGGWHTTPLWRPDFDTLRVPRWVIDG